MSYIPGDFWRICDRCGFRMRSSMSLKTWDGLMVCFADFEPRHPQDFVRGRLDRQIVPDPRPYPVDVIVGPLTTVTTAAASAGATSINVENSARMQAGDHIGIALSDGNVHRATVNDVPTATSITVTNPTKLPGAVSSGARIVDYDAVAEAVLP